VVVSALAPHPAAKAAVIIKTAIRFLFFIIKPPN
jgi:hypothetical protein